MRKVAGLVFAMAGLAGCGGERAEEEPLAVADAEAPYAAPVAPPAHSGAGLTIVESEDASLKSNPAAGAAKAFASRVVAPDGGPASKVDNFAGAKPLSADRNVKAIAVAEEALKSRPEGDGPAFGDIVGDAARGRALFQRCAECHPASPGVNAEAPSLYGVVGRDAGTAPGYAYSAFLTTAEFVWTEDAIYAYLENPRDYLPGTISTEPPVPDEQERADIVAYLATLGD